MKGTTDIQDWDYDFNTTFGNMTKRKSFNNEETFTYDSQDRLLARYRGATGTTLTYDTGGEGNITSKTDVGTYNYNSTYPHQVEEITNPTSLMQDLPTQNITYTKFNKTSTLSVTDTGLDKDLTITYGPDQLRVKTVLEDNSSTVLTKYYALDMYEKEVHATEGTRELYYINTPSGISAILESTSSYDSIFYIHTDILGSYDVITDDQGSVRERLSFDPWGRRRNTSSWDYTGVPASFKFDRGFTGHEHLDDFSLINMNGRMYDPIMAMFLSPDTFIQSPHETQNFNRYAYVMNNPLKYTDPSGYSYDPIDDEWTDVYWYDPYPYDVPARERSYRYTMTWEGVKFWGTKAAWNSAHGILPGGPTGMDYDAWHKSGAEDKNISFMEWFNQGDRYGSSGFFMHQPSICLGYNGPKGKGFHCGEAGVIWSRPRWIYIPTNMYENENNITSPMQDSKVYEHYNDEIGMSSNLMVNLLDEYLNGFKGIGNWFTIGTVLYDTWSFQEGRINKGKYYYNNFGSAAVIALNSSYGLPAGLLVGPSLVFYEQAYEFIKIQYQNISNFFRYENFIPKYWGAW